MTQTMIPRGPILRAVDDQPTTLPERECISFTGTRDFYTRLGRQAQWRFVSYLERLLARFDSAVIVQGGCDGIDQVVGRTAHAINQRWRSRALHVHTVLPADHRLVAPDFQMWSDTYEQMPEGTSYLDRDQVVVNLATNKLYGYPLRPENEQPRSGTWATIRRAKRRDLSVEVLTLAPRNEGEHA